MQLFKTWTHFRTFSTPRQYLQKYAHLAQNLFPFLHLIIFIFYIIHRTFCWNKSASAKDEKLDSFLRSVYLFLSIAFCYYNTNKRRKGYIFQNISQCMNSSLVMFQHNHIVMLYYSLLAEVFMENEAEIYSCCIIFLLPAFQTFLDSCWILNDGTRSTINL